MSNGHSTIPEDIQTREGTCLYIMLRDIKHTVTEVKEKQEEQDKKCIDKDEFSAVKSLVNLHAGMLDRMGHSVGKFWRRIFEKGFTAAIGVVCSTDVLIRIFHN